MTCDEQPYSEVFDLIRQYAVLRGWIPIGWKDFRVRDWRIRVNGTRQAREGVPPYHALIEHEYLLAVMICNPHRGNVAGWSETEWTFCRDMRAALEEA